MKPNASTDEFLTRTEEWSRTWLFAAGITLLMMVVSFDLRPSGDFRYLFNPFSLLLLTVLFLFLYRMEKYIHWYYSKRREILALFHAWERETAHLSGGRETHRFHKEIVSRGRPAVKFLLEELSERQCHVFTMLGEITRAHPVPKEYSENIPMMRKYWLAWGKENGYL